jgi:biotin operon repressor
MKGPIENEVYASIIGSCQALEYEGPIRINGHHLAQKLTKEIVIGLLPKEQRKIYDVLTTEFQTTKEIAIKVGMSTKIVSTQLKQIKDKTLLVYSVVLNQRRLVWKKL